MLVEMTKYARKLADTEPFKVRSKSICAEPLANLASQSMLVGEVNPGPDVTTDEQLAGTLDGDDGWGRR
jgi:hypothetical protein